jgi:sirohydrochlorin ferrochelatase
MMTTAILLMGHGSRVAAANQALYAIAELVRAQRPGTIVEVAFREQHPPNIQAGIDACVAQGAHVLEDLPAEMDEARRRHAGLQLIMGDHLGIHPKLAEIVGERVDEALARAGWTS